MSTQAQVEDPDDGHQAGHQRTRSTLWPLAFLIGLLMAIASLGFEFGIPSPLTSPRPHWFGFVRIGVLLLPWLVGLALVIRRVRGDRYAPWLSYLVGVGLPWVLPFAFFFGPDLSEYLRRTDFDSQAWKAAAGQSGIPRTEDRLTMVDDLLDSGVLDDKSLSEVLELLGPDDGPEGTGYGAGYFRNWDLVYWLGTERGFIGIDSEWLVVKFDSTDRVSRCRIATD